VGVSIPEEYGGPGATPVFNVILSYELGRSLGYATVGGNIATDLATMIVMQGGTEAQKQALAPRILAGAIQCMALTEPDAGSDAGAITSTAIRDGDDYVIRGSKVYISNGLHADLIYVVAKTDPTAGFRGMSMFLVEAGAPGLTRRKLKTMAFPPAGSANCISMTCAYRSPI
jgi:acyl-CoA dehydrogenase